MKQEILNKQQLNSLSKDELVSAVLSMQNTIANQEERISQLLQQLFGRKSEKHLSEEDDGQLNIFNEAEAIAETSEDKEPEEIQTITYTRKKTAGKREQDLSGLPVEIVNHELSDDELKEAFGNDSYIRLPDTVYKKLEIVPTQYKVIEHHLAVYKCNKTGKIVKAHHPKEMLNNSIATPSLVAGLMNLKYANAMPLYRIEKEIDAGGIHIGRQNMAHWIIKCTENYLSLIYERLHKILCSQSVLQADETPVQVTKDGRPAGSKSYMWVYRTSEMIPEKSIILYDYEQTRNADRPRKFLSGFSGTLMCDGYSGYTAMADGSPQVEIANCFAHARRPFADYVKAMKDSGHTRGSVAGKALSMIQKIYKADDELKELPSNERLKRRCLEVKPLVEAYLAWAEKVYPQLPPNSAVGKGIYYSIQRKEGLQRFLSNGNIPIDNSASERSIRPFTIARKNFVMIDTVEGAKASAIVFSLVETAKANGLKVYEYLKYLLSEIPKHMDQSDLSFVDNLLPWSESLPDSCN